MGSEGDLLPGSLDYIHGLMPFMGANLCMIFLDSMLKTLGHPRFAMIMIVSSILLNGFNISSASFFTALDNAKWSPVISACRGLVFIIWGIILLLRLFGTGGVWMTVAIAELLTAMISFGLLRKILAGK